MGPPPERRAGGGKGRTEVSSWVGDWERNLIKKKGPNAEREYRTQCKLGREIMLKGTPAQWVADSRLAPMGLSCLEHLKAKAEELGLVLEPAAPVAKVPAPRREKAPEELVHGKASTYSVHKCRCVPCREANSARSTSYRRARRQRAEAPA